MTCTLPQLVTGANNINIADIMAGGANNKRKRVSDNSSLKAARHDGDDDHHLLDEDDGKTATTSKCKGATTIPIFLKSKFLNCYFYRGAAAAVGAPDDDGAFCHRTGPTMRLRTHVIVRNFCFFQFV